jgi:hypothetical protein
MAGAEDGLLLEVDAVDVAEVDLDVRGVSELHADGHRDVRRIESSRCHLVKQRLEQMMVAAVDQDDADAILVGERLRRVQPREAGADDNDRAHHCQIGRLEDWQIQEWR